VVDISFTVSHTLSTARRDGGVGGYPQENSAETNLRLGNKSQVIGFLKSFPFLLNVDLVVLRQIEVHLYDLFAGYEVRRPRVVMDDSGVSLSRSRAGVQSGGWAQ